MSGCVSFTSLHDGWFLVTIYCDAWKRREPLEQLVQSGCAGKAANQTPLSVVNVICSENTANEITVYIVRRIRPGENAPEPGLWDVSSVIT